MQGSPLEVLVFRDLERRALGRKIDQVLDQLRAGDFRSAEVKKLKNAGLYRARIDDKNRLLFKVGAHAGRGVLLVLEVVHNHDYASARFLNGAACAEDDFEPVTAPAAPTDTLRFVHPTSPALHMLDKPLSFDDAQATVLAAPLPVIVIGSAGSGKTALTLEKLKTLPGHGLYLTRSSYLVENARTLYFANRYANDGQEVEFLSLAELLETIDVPTGREATWADFAAWYERVRGTFKLREPHRIYEEIKGVLTGAAQDQPFLTEDEYLGLGVRQSIFVGDERRIVYQVFERWRVYQAERGLFDANVAAWERRGRAEPRYDFLVIDEVQDITLVELRLALATLRDRRSFLLCGDSNQIVHPNLFSWARVKSLFYGEDARGESPLDRIHLLVANYRNTQAVTTLANRLLLVKQRRFGSIDRESNYLVQCVSDEPGRVELVVDGPQVQREIDHKTRRSARTAIIVMRDEDKPAARAVFATPLVFAVHEAKGLEYDHVVLWNLVSGAARELRECTAGVTLADLDGESVYARARDKTDKSLDAYKFYINALYVAITRAVRSLLIVEREPQHPLFELLVIDRLGGQVELAAEESSREDWQREARRLELQGKREQADQIRREILDHQPVPWPVIDPTTYPSIHARALGAGPREKAAQQLLFEYALTYDAPWLIPQLAEAGFRHAKKPESGRAYIDQTHYLEYQFKRSPVLAGQLRKHGLDFRNPINETPLMVAARLGKPELVGDLLAQGADPELTDTAGRNPLRVALMSWLEGQAMKVTAFADVYQRLASAPAKVKLGARMTKLDPSTMEWFLLNLCLAHYRRMMIEGFRTRGTLAFRAPEVAGLLARFPPTVLPPHRMKREYVSAMLAKNELSSASPYNRRLFVRVAHGAYVLNPALEIEIGGAWRAVSDLMELPLFLDTLGPPGDALRRGLAVQRRAIDARLAAVAPSLEVT